MDKTEKIFTYLCFMIFTEAVQMKFDNFDREVVGLQSALQDSARLVLRLQKWTTVFKAMRNKLH